MHTRIVFKKKSIKIYIKITITATFMTIKQMTTNAANYVLQAY